MQKITRREILRLLALGAGGLTVQQFLTACQSIDKGSFSPTLQSNPAKSDIGEASPTMSNKPTDGVVEVPTTTTPPTPQLVVAHGKDPESLVRAVVDGLGGMQKFVPSGGWVIIKPNICNSYHGYEYASTTNPWVVAAVVKLAFEAGAKKVQVMDSPFGGSASDAYVSSGIAEQVEAAGGEMVLMPDFKFKTMKIENPLGLNSAWIYEDVFAADTLINLPIAKHHSLARLTMGMKNLMGIIQARENIHVDIPKRLTDLNRKVKSTLTIVDAVRILVKNGPTGGNLEDVRQLDTVYATTDIVAADSFGTTLFDMKPEDLKYLKVAAENGLGTMNLNDLNIQELTIGG